jgi:hypothetical protein
MRVETRLGTFEEVVGLAADQAPTLLAIRALVAEIHPDAVEVASRKERSVWWGTGPGKMTHGYVYAMPHTGHVNLGFFRGTSLPDPEGLLTGTGKALRHVKLTSPDQVSAPAIRALIEAARNDRASGT